MNERSPDGLAGLALGVAALPPDVRGRVDVLAGPADTAAGVLTGGAGPAPVIVDPPRKGLDPALRAALAAWPPRRLVYVSCDVASFLDDAQALLAGGALGLAELEAFAFFPYTDHVETLARFEAT